VRGISVTEQREIMIKRWNEVTQNYDNESATTENKFKPHQIVVPQMLPLLVEVKLLLRQLPSLRQQQLWQELAAETKIQISSPLLSLPGGMHALHITAHHN